MILNKFRIIFPLYQLLELSLRILFGSHVQVWNWKVPGPEGIYNHAGYFLFVLPSIYTFLIHLNYPLICDLVYVDEFFLSPLPTSPVGREAFLVPQIYHLCPLAKALTPHYSLSFTYLVMLLAPCSPLKGEFHHLDQVPLSQCSLKPFSYSSCSKVSKLMAAKAMKNVTKIMKLTWLCQQNCYGGRE